MFSRCGLLLLLVLFVGCASLAFATHVAPCPVASVATYEVSGFECSEGKILFSNFSFSSVATGNAPQLTPTDVTVVPIGNGFAFRGSFTTGDIIGVESTQSTSIRYTAKGPLTGATLCCQGLVTDSMISDAFVGETLCSKTGSCFSGCEFGGSLCINIDNCCGPFVDPFFGPCPIESAGPCAALTFSPQNVLYVSDTIFLLAGPSDQAIANGIAYGFSTPPVPEPASCWLFLTGLSTIAALLPLAKTR
jgi:hypothetical protein